MQEDSCWSGNDVSRQTGYPLGEALRRRRPRSSRARGEIQASALESDRNRARDGRSRRRRAQAAATTTRELDRRLSGGKCATAASSWVPSTPSTRITPWLLTLETDGRDERASRLRAGARGRGEIETASHKSTRGHARSETSSSWNGSSPASRNRMAASNDATSRSRKSSRRRRKISSRNAARSTSGPTKPPRAYPCKLRKPDPTAWRDACEVDRNGNIR
jgi:hypothetical protein